MTRWERREYAPASAGSAAYWNQPSARCLNCEREFSLRVGHMHGARTGHKVVPVYPEQEQEAA